MSGRLADTKQIWGRGHSKMTRAERSRANAFWQQRMRRAERLERLFR